MASREDCYPQFFCVAKSAERAKDALRSLGEGGPPFCSPVEQFYVSAIREDRRPQFFCIRKKAGSALSPLPYRLDEWKNYKTAAIFLMKSKRPVFSVRSA